MKKVLPAIIVIICLSFFSVAHSTPKKNSNFCSLFLSLSKIANQNKNVKQEIKRSDLTWLNINLDVDLGEYSKIYKMRRSKIITKLKKDFDVQVLLKERDLADKEFLGPSIASHWRSFTMFVNTPRVELKKLQEAIQFYSATDIVGRALGLYLDAYGFFVKNEKEILAYSSRPLGSKNLIIVDENFSGAVILHELTHHLISKFNKREKENRAEYFVKMDWIMKAFEHFELLDLENVLSSKTEEHLHEGGYAMFRARSLFFREELAINQFLLKSRIQIGLSQESIDFLLGIYFRDYHWGNRFLEEQLFDIESQNNLYNFTNIQGRKEFINEINSEINFFRSEATKFLNASPDLRERAADLMFKAISVD